MAEHFVGRNRPILVSTAAILIAITVGCTAGDANPDDSSPDADTVTTTSSAPSKQRLVAEFDGPPTDGSVAHVKGSGFTPRSDVAVVQCVTEVRATRSRDDCDLAATVPAHANAAGEFDAEIPVRTVISTGRELEVDCIASGCSIVAADITDTSASASTPIEWAQEATTPPRPELSIETLTFEADGKAGAAEVRGAGFAPGSIVTLVQCPLSDAGELDVEDCLYDHGATATADDHGNISARISVFGRFQRSTGELIDCVSDPGQCALADPFPRDRLNRPSHVAFDAAEF